MTDFLSTLTLGGMYCTVCAFLEGITVGEKVGVTVGEKVGGKKVKLFGKFVSISVLVIFVEDICLIVCVFGF